MNQSDRHSDAVVLECAMCRQKLRIPLDRLEAIGHCPRCQFRFQVARNVADASIPFQLQPQTAVPATKIGRRRFVHWSGGVFAASCGTWMIAKFLFGADESRSEVDGLIDEFNPDQSDGGLIEERDPVQWSEYETLRIACIGDSITHGSGLVDREKMCYPAVLQKLLGRRYEVRNFASPGRSVSSKADFPYTAENIYLEALDYRPHIVVVMLGTNDAWPQNWAYADEFATDFRRLISSFQSPRLKTRIYLCTPTPVWPGSGLDEKRIRKDVVPRIKKLGKELRLRVIDLCTPFRDRNDLFSDNLHPNETGAKQIADLIAQVIKSSAQ